jgi:hypothetical protein
MLWFLYGNYVQTIYYGNRRYTQAGIVGVYCLMLRGFIMTDRAKKILIDCIITCIAALVFCVGWIVAGAFVLRL